ncbi:hypothetical protein CDAR_84361 [Caerostris darwini]|uniref:Uncharacterized protein n=1 Tax=Caerostris darwini TaxID=1538125 RepID=A0AAV4X2J0_9ARAC|nr:hypothetical protein CDAR_84361 [Caerostris darwini]
MNSVPKNRFALIQRLLTPLRIPVIIFCPRNSERKRTENSSEKRNGNRKEIFGNSKTGIIMIDHAKKDLEKDPVRKKKRKLAGYPGLTKRD